MRSRTLYFTGPRSLSVETEEVPDPGPGELAVRTAASAISAGTEGLVYRGEAPTDVPATVDGCSDLSYPVSYGYAAVGRVTDVGEGVDDDWLERRVFAYRPHRSRFVADAEAVVPVPEGVGTREATLLANAETAVNLVLDGDPTLGERAVVFGQGVVGLLTGALLAETPLETLVGVDRIPERRDLAESFGVDAAVAPDDDPAATLADRAGGRADLAYELSGNPDALDDAVDAVGFDGRVVVGSWYGTKSADLDLGGRFHRDRIDLRSSQVSTIAPRHSGRWDRERRHEEAWRWLAEFDLDPLFTHEFTLEDAPEAYRLLDERPDEALQVVLTYE